VPSRLETFICKQSSAGLKHMSPSASGPKLTIDDHFAIGRLVMQYNFIELSLRRMVEAWGEAGLFSTPIKARPKEGRIGAIEAAVQAMLSWPEKELSALKRLAEIRNLRKLVAHCAECACRPP
jgi:hypothetical protein